MASAHVSWDGAGLLASSSLLKLAEFCNVMTCATAGGSGSSVAAAAAAAAASNGMGGSSAAAAAAAAAASQGEHRFP